MLLGTDRVEVQLQEVRVCPEHHRGLVIITPRNAGDGCPLWVDVQPGEAFQIEYEMRGRQTSRTQALMLCGHIASLLQGGIVAGLLIDQAPRSLRAAMQVRTPDAIVEIPTEPGQVFAASIALGIPLFADRVLFELGEPALPPLSPPTEAFLQMLDFSGFESRENQREH